MRKILSVAVVFLCILFITTLIIQPVSAKTPKNNDNGSAGIPENVLKIAQKSCVKCHADPAKGMSISMLNLTKWENLTPEKQASKAKAMCNLVTKEKMPPKRFRESNPEALPSTEEIKTLCDWATSIQVVNK